LLEKKRIARMARGAYSGTDTGGLCDYLEDEGYRVRVVDTDDFPNGLILAVRPRKIPRVVVSSTVGGNATIADSSKSDVHSGKAGIEDSSSKKKGKAVYVSSFTYSSPNTKLEYVFKPSVDILVIFRGSNGLDIRDWYINLQAWSTGTVETEYIQLQGLHAGFAKRAALLLPQITKILDGFLHDIRRSDEEIKDEDHLNISLTCIGHSQGASLASLMGFILDKYYHKGSFKRNNAENSSADGSKEDAVPNTAAAGGSATHKQATAGFFFSSFFFFFFLVFFLCR
jgi:hypothetical protein